MVVTTSPISSTVPRDADARNDVVGREAEGGKRSGFDAEKSGDCESQQDGEQDADGVPQVTDEGGDDLSAAHTFGDQADYELDENPAGVQ